jgi:hypothetical protein
MMNPTPKPTVEELLHWLLGELSADEMAKIDMLVASGDAAVTRTLGWLEWLVREARRTANDAPPPDLHARLVDLFPRPPERSGFADLGPACEGELVFDGRRDHQLVGTRGAVTPGSFQLAYTSHVGDVVLDLRPDGRGSVVINGQLLTDYDLTDPLVVTASVQNDSSVNVSGDGFGRFKLGGFREMPSLIVIKNRGLRVSVAIGPGEAS